MVVVLRLSVAVSDVLSNECANCEDHEDEGQVVRSPIILARFGFFLFVDDRKHVINDLPFCESTKDPSDLVGIGGGETESSVERRKMSCFDHILNVCRLTEWGEGESRREER